MIIGPPTYMPPCLRKFSTDGGYPTKIVQQFLLASMSSGQMINMALAWCYTNTNGSTASLPPAAAVSSRVLSIDAKYFGRWLEYAFDT